MKQISMSKTILITGSSSGIGKSTAEYFASKGWNVAATMRTPSKDTELAKLPNVKLYALDVNNEASIEAAIENAIKDFGGIDVLFNNAGYAAVGAFETSTEEDIKKQFDTNVFGVMRVTRAILPYFRSKNDGTIITTTSMGGLITFPLYSLYHGTKWAIEGFMESLHYELRSFNIKVKCVEPGAIKTDFYDRSMVIMKKDGVNMYDNYTAVCVSNMDKFALNAPGPLVIAKKVFQAANSNNFRLRYPKGNNAPLLLFLRRILPNSWFFGLVRMIVEKGFKKK
jgi:NAD(P)-dependent dehydrogenase (short-subunit alcohol dehydrogenase family)